MGFLEDFYIAGIMPSECKDKPTKEYYELQKQIEDLDKEFISSLTDEQKAIYEKICSLRLDSGYMVEVNTFVSAFKLGSKFIINSIK